jgi:coenzyme F420-reducing hydrogenase beta subunit
MRAVTVKKAAEIRDPNDLSLYKKGAGYQVCEGCLICSRVCPVVDGFIENELENVHKFFAAKFNGNIGSQDGGVASGIIEIPHKQGKIDCAVGVPRNDLK